MFAFVIPLLAYIGACSAQGALQVATYLEFVEYIADGYFGVVDVDFNACVSSPQLPNPGTLTFKIYYGERFQDGEVDYAVSDFYFISSDVYAGLGQIQIDSTGFISFKFNRVGLPSYETENTITTVCGIEQGARLYIYGTGSVAAGYNSYNLVKSAFNAGLVASVHIDGSKCTNTQNSTSIANSRFFAYAQDWRLYDAGTEDETIDVVISSLQPLIGNTGEEINVYSYNRIMMTPDNQVLLSRAYWSTAEGGIQETYECELGNGVEVKSLGIEFADRYNAYRDMQEMLLQGNEAYISFDISLCELDTTGDDIFGNTTLEQRRYITEWTYVRDTPAPGRDRGISSNYYFWAISEDDDFAVFHENIDISEAEVAYIHFTRLAIPSFESVTALYTCPLGSGLWLTSPAGNSRTEIDTPEEFVAAARRGDPLDLIIEIDSCRSNVSTLPGLTFGTYIRNSGSQNNGNEFVYYASELGLDPTDFDGLAMSTADITMDANGDFTIIGGLFDVESWLNYEPQVVTCDWIDVTIFS